jgi:starch synthase
MAKSPHHIAGRRSRIASPRTALDILMIASEAVPFSKTGGLADVAGSLPAALARLGHTTTLVVPRYRTGDATAQHGTSMGRLEIAFPIRTVSVDVLERRLSQNVTLWLLECPELYDRDGIYGTGTSDYEDSPLRFATLCRAAIEAAIRRGRRIDVVHAHDWQGGLAPVYLSRRYAWDPVIGGAGTLFTIHNIAYQGVYPRDWVPALGLDWDLFHPAALEFWGSISLLKAGIKFARVITTVSPTYAREIQSPEYGYGFEGIVSDRRDDLVGILNGIDTRTWDPARDPYLPMPFGIARLENKTAAKRAVLAELGLPSDGDALARPLIGMVTRLVDQKGLDLVAGAADALLALDVGFAVAGTGEARYEDLWRSLAARAPGRIGARIGFDERLAHLIEGGADMFLMPSRYEPCGLNQMYSLRYGTVPIVRAVGGLDDTVVDYAGPESGGTGFKFRAYSSPALVAAVERALAVFRDVNAWRAIQVAGMRQDHSWHASAREYVKVYERAAGRPIEG